MSRKMLLPGLVASLLVTACADGALEPSNQLLSGEETATLAAELDAITGAALDRVMVGFGIPGDVVIFRATPDAVIPIDHSFTHARRCPAGGSVTIAGRTTGEAHRESRSLTTETTAVKTDVDCAFGTPRGIVITVTGDPNVVMRANRKLVNGTPSGPQTQSQKGAYTYRTSDGRSGSCTIDVTSTFDPAAMTMTLRGTNCGRAIDVTRRRGG